MKKFKRILTQFILPVMEDMITLVCACCAMDSEYVVIKAIGVVCAVCAAYGIFKSYDSWDMYGDME